ncbi:MAG: hypothetical protein QOJ50_1855, partial [Cryptosporangiaceae bacterium]|nr:hypothetical protein [Cryptosporangiaceae bacterium]
MTRPDLTHDRPSRAPAEATGGTPIVNKPPRSAAWVTRAPLLPALV